jgi:looped-hinge helix DNA binding domain, AbrB family
MRITSKGQVTIPVAIREQAGLLPHTEVEFVLEDGKVVIRPADGLTKGQRLVARLIAARKHFNLGMTTDEYMEMTRGPYNDVDDPVTEVHESPTKFRR